MIFHENGLPADDSHETSRLICFFILWKSSKICNCRLLQIVCGTLWVNFLPIIVVCWLPLQNLEAATGPLLVAPFCIKWPLAKGRVGHHQHHANGQILDSVFPSEITENLMDLTLKSVLIWIQSVWLWMICFFNQSIIFQSCLYGSSVLNQYQSVSG